MIVCHCAVVSDRDVTEAVDAGARTLAGICRSTGAGRDCGSCVFSVKRLLCEHEPAVSVTATAPSGAGVLEVEVAAS